MHICIGKLCLNLFRQWLVTCSAPCHWTLGNIFQWYLNQNTTIFIQENEFEQVIYKGPAIVIQPQMSHVVCMTAGVSHLSAVCSPIRQVSCVTRVGMNYWSSLMTLDNDSITHWGRCWSTSWLVPWLCFSIIMLSAKIYNRSRAIYN